MIQQITTTQRHIHKGCGGKKEKDHNNTYSYVTGQGGSIGVDAPDVQVVYVLNIRDRH